MKQKIISFCLACLLPALALAQHQVSKAEYFIDTDPGQGLATPLSVPTAADTVNYTQNITIPTSLTEGPHRIYYRTYADSLGFAGRWSMTETKLFFVGSFSGEIVAAEYFIDTDPGVGLATPTALPTVADSINETLNITTPSGLASGPHKLYLRTQNSLGKWSLTDEGKLFFVTGPGSTITAAEFFIDTDPGVGNGTALTIPAPSDSINENFNILIPASTPGGPHKLYVRTKKANVWSLTADRLFIVDGSAGLIDYAEYFFDTDPGVGNGVSFAVPSPSDSINQLSNIATTGLLSGDHRLYVRTRTAAGKYSQASPARKFYVLPSVAAAEYFYDTDPGVGNGTAFAAFPPADSIEIMETLTAPCLSPGPHRLYVRTQNDRGVWGLTEKDSLFFANPNMMATASLPGAGPTGTPVKVLGSGGQAPYTYKTLAGTATADSIFLTANNSSATLVAIDACSYKDTTTISTPAAPMNIATAGTGTSTMNFTGWRFPVYMNDANGDIIGALADNGENLGNVTMSYFKNTSGTVRKFENDAFYLDRNWYVSAPDANPMNAKTVSFYALDAEFNALAAVDPAIMTTSDLRYTKYDGPNENLSETDNSYTTGTGILLVPTAQATFTGTATSGYSLSLDVNSFSEFYQSKDYVTPLYVRKVDLSGSYANGKTTLTWRSEFESQMSHYAVQKQSVRGNWDVLGNVTAKNGNLQSYSFVDAEPGAGMNYYRLQVVNEDGSTSFTPVVSVFVGEQSSITLAPNPAREMVSIAGVAEGTELKLFDATGRIVWQQTATQSLIQVNVSDFAAGNYMLSVDGVSSQRLLILPR